MVFLWFSVGVPMIFLFSRFLALVLWFSYGVPMVPAWFYHGSPIVSLLFPDVFHIAFSWFSLGFPVIVLLLCMVFI